MKAQFLKIAGVTSESDFYKKYPSEEAFFEAHPEAQMMARGGEMIKRQDGSYSKRGLWDNIRANKGSGKKPSKDMLEQEKKIRANEMEFGGYAIPDMGAGGYHTMPNGMVMADKDPQDMESYKDGGGIPDRYKNKGFTKVGAKKQSNRPGKKWMVLAKKGDDYKIVHGGYDGMKDFSQHHSKDRQKNFWNRMGGKNSSKATDPFSPLYWHKRFGTWADGGEYEDGSQAIIGSFDENGKYVPGKDEQLYNYESKYLLKDMEKTPVNETLKAVAGLNDPKNVYLQGLPDKGLFGGIKALVSGASALSTSALGYKKLIDKPSDSKQYVFDRKDGSMTDMQYLREKTEASKYLPMEEYLPEDPNPFRSTNDEPRFKDGGMPQYQTAGQATSLTYEQWLEKNKAKLSDQYKSENTPSSKYGDPLGTKFAVQAIGGLGAVDNFIGAQQDANTYQELMRTQGMTDNKFQSDDSFNPFGNYLPNVGPGNNFQPNRSTKASSFMNGGEYAEGGEYEVSEEELQEIIRNGGEIEFL